MERLIQEFADAVTLSQTRIRDVPPLVLLCGGPIGDDDQNPSSARHFFQQHLKHHAPELARSLVLAERVNEDYKDAEYPDLLRLEEHLADLVTLIVVFVESPGSIAELGTFAALDTLGPKTLAVIEEQYLRRAHSFIKDGPVARLTSYGDDRVHCYDWLTEASPPCLDKERLSIASNFVTSAIEEHLARSPKSPAFRADNNGHIMLLLADLANLFLLLTSDELESILKRLQVPIKHTELRQYLFLLEKLHLLTRFTYSHQNWYASERTLIDYAYVSPDRKKDRLSWRAKHRSAYAEGERYRKRKEAYAAYVKRLAKVQDA